jgi:Leucine-rich repeat (LRR) protein
METPSLRRKLFAHTTYLGPGCLHSSPGKQRGSVLQPEVSVSHFSTKLTMRYYLTNFFVTSILLVGGVEAVADTRGKSRSRVPVRKRQNVIDVGDDLILRKEEPAKYLEEFVSTTEEMASITSRLLQSDFSVPLKPTAAPTEYPSLASQTATPTRGSPSPPMKAPIVATTAPSRPSMTIAPTVKTTSPVTSNPTFPVPTVKTDSPTEETVTTPAPTTLTPTSPHPTDTPTVPAYPTMEQASSTPSRHGETLEPTVQLPDTPAPVSSVPTHFGKTNSPSTTAYPTFQRLTASPAASPTPEPTRQLEIPTDSPTDFILLCPSIPDSGCSVCGNNRLITEPDAIFAFPGQPKVRCGELQVAGEIGLIPLEQCSFLPDFINDVCGCTLCTPVPVSEPTPAPPPVTIGSCPSIAPSGCSVCGDKKIVTQPDAIFVFPGQPEARCGELQAAGEIGLVPLDQCSFLPDLIDNVCSCTLCTPAPEPTQAPATLWPIVATLEPIAAPDARPTPPPVLINSDSCPSIPDNGCSICGDNRCITQPDTIFKFPGQPEVRCGALQDAGETGLVPLDQCRFLPGLIDDICGCTVGTSLSPSPITELAPLGLAIDLFDLISSVALKNGTEFNSADTYQSKAFVWLSHNTDLDSYSDRKKVQRYALACIYFSTYAVRSKYTDLHLGNGNPPPGWMKADVWLSDVDECDDLDRWYGIICDNNGNVEAISLRGNGLTGSLPPETSLLSDSLIRLDISDNWIHNPGDEFNSFLGKLSNMEYLSYRNTFFEYDRGVPSEIGLLTNLIAFDASNTQYSGPLSGDAFGNKPLLQSVQLSGNYFDAGTIPKQLLDVPKLKYLALENSNLTGDLSFVEDMNEIIELWIGHNSGITGSLPASIAKVTKLEILSITHCGIMGPIPSEMSLLKSLKQVWLYDNRLTGTVPTELGGLTQLSTLELEFNSITGTIPEELCELRLPNGSLTVLEADCVGEVVCDCCTACFGTATPTASPNRDPTSAPSATALTALEKGGTDSSDLSNAPLAPQPPTSYPSNQPTFRMPSMPPSEVPSMSSTSALIYSVALYGGTEFGHPDSYQSQALAWLESHTNLDDASDVKIVQRYTLACIYYSTDAVKTPHTDFTYGADVAVPGWIKSTNWMDTEKDECQWYGLDCDSNAEVSSIELPNNRLTGNFPPEVKLLKDSLIRIDIMNNIVWNPGHEYNAFIGELTNMEYLFIGSTNFEYDGIPLEIGKLTKLIEFDCSYSLYHGALRGEVFPNLSELKHLVMGGNSYNSSVPTELSQLQNLKWLFIDYADLTGDISFLTSMGSLKEVWLDTNPNLKGSIPASIGKLSALESLSVTNCGLTGTIPSQVGSMSNMEQLWFYGNALTGRIPTEMGNLNRMRILELENNMLTGSMPTAVCFNRSPIGSVAILKADCETVSCPCCSSCA